MRALKKMRLVKAKTTSRACFGALLAGAVVSAPVSAIEIDDAREAHPWPTYQGGPDHTGHVDVALDFTGVDTTAEISRVLSVPAADSPSGVDISDVELLETFHYPSTDGTHLSPNLSQATYNDGFLLITNRGYRVPHYRYLFNFLLSIGDQAMEGIGDAIESGQAPSFDDKGYDDTIGFNRTETVWADGSCPVSQSMAINVNGRILSQSNSFTFDTAEGNTFCNDGTTPTQEQVTTHFNHPRYFVAQDDSGSLDYYWNVGDTVRKTYLANENDEFLAPVEYGGSIYIAGGGSATGVNSANNGSVYAFSPDGENLWPNAGTAQGVSGYAYVGPNDLYAPAVNENYVIVYTARWRNPDGSLTTLLESPLDTRDAQLTALNRADGSVAFTIDDVNYVPQNDAQPLRLNIAPVLANDRYVLVTNVGRESVNRGRIVTFDLQDRAIEWSVSGGFEGQLTYADDKVYALSRDLGALPADSSDDIITIKALNLDDGSPVMNGLSQWEWSAPAGETPQSPFIVTDSHVLVSTRDAAGQFANTYAVNLSTVANDWVLPSGGKLSLIYDVLVVASSRASVTDVASGPPATSRSEVQIYELNIASSERADISVSATSPTDTQAVQEGSTISYQVTVNDGGNSGVNSATVTANVPFGLRFEVANDENCNVADDVLTCTVAVSGTGVLNLTATVIATGTLNMRFTANSTSFVDDALTNNSATITNSGLAATRDLNVSATSPSALSENAQGTVTMTVSNTGTGTSIDTSLTANLPTGLTYVSSTPATGSCAYDTTSTLLTCSLGSLAASASTTVEMVVSANGVSDQGSISIAASGTLSDSNSTNNSTTTSITVQQTQPTVEPEPEGPTQEEQDRAAGAESLGGSSGGGSLPIWFVIAMFSLISRRLMMRR